MACEWVVNNRREGRKRSLEKLFGKRPYCSLSSDATSEAGAGEEKTLRGQYESGWYAHLPAKVEAMRVISFEEPLERQFALVNANLGNRHLRYDLVTLCLRALRPPLTEEYDKSVVLLGVAETSLQLLSHAEKFKEQLKSHLEKHITPLQRLDIRAKIGEHRTKLVKASDASNTTSRIPLMAAYAHYLMLDGQLEEAYRVVQKAHAILQSLLYFQLGLKLEEEAKNMQIRNGNQDSGPLMPQSEEGQTFRNPSSSNASSFTNPSSPSSHHNSLVLSKLEDAAAMYCRSVLKNARQSESYTNLAVLEFYQNVDTIKMKQVVEKETLKTGEAKKQKKKEVPIQPSKQQVSSLQNPSQGSPSDQMAPSDHLESDSMLKRRKMDKMKQSLVWLDLAILTDDKKENYLAHYHRGFILEVAGEDKKGVEKMLKSLHVSSPSFKPLDRPNSATMSGTWKEKAREAYATALQINPHHMESHTHLAILLMDEKLYDQALQHFEKARDVAGKGEMIIQMNLANCHAALGHIEAAMKEMVIAMRAEPKMAELQYQMGMMLLKWSKDRKDEALASFQRALQLHAAHPDIPFDPSKVYNVMVPLLKEMAHSVLQNGEFVPDFIRASKLLSRALDLLPPSSSAFPPLLLSLSFAFMKANRPDAALEALSDAHAHFLQLYPQSVQNQVSNNSSTEVSTRASDSSDIESGLKNVLESESTPPGISPAESDLSKSSDAGSSAVTDWPPAETSLHRDSVESHPSSLVPAFEDYFRMIQQQQHAEDANPEIIFEQLKQHFSSLEETDALIQYLSSVPRKEEPRKAKKPLKLKKKKKLATKSQKRTKEAAKLANEAVHPSSSVDASSGVAGNLSSEIPPNGISSNEISAREKQNSNEISAKQYSSDSTDVGDSPANEIFDDMDGMEGIEEAIRGELKEHGDDQLESLMQYKAKLHYNIAFCMNYIGELKEMKNHLEMALATDPACTSDYILHEPPSDDSSFAEDDLIEEDPDIVVGDPDEAIQKRAARKVKAKAKQVSTLEESHDSPINVTKQRLQERDEEMMMMEELEKQVQEIAKRGPNDALFAYNDTTEDDHGTLLEENALPSIEETSARNEAFIEESEGTEGQIPDEISLSDGLSPSDEIPLSVKTPSKGSTSHEDSYPLVLLDRHGGPPKLVKKHNNPLTADQIQRKVGAKAYSKLGLQYQLENLITPPDGSPMTHSTRVLLEWIGDMQEKHKHTSLEDVDKELLKFSSHDGPAPIRKAKTKRRKNLKYAISASKRWSQAGADDGFNSPSL